MSQTIATAVSQRLYEAIKYSGAGARATIRHITPGSGPAPAANPPTVEGATVAAAAAAGATTISLAASAASGQLVAGDQIVIGGVAYTVGAPVAATALPATPGFVDVPISPPLVTAAAAGESVSFVFAADQLVYVSPTSIPLQLANGSSIVAGDIMLKISAWNLATVPEIDDLVLFNGETFRIIARMPVFAAGAIAGYSLQARTA